MGAISQPEPVKLFIGLIASDPAIFDECRGLLVERLGPVGTASDVFDFDFPDYKGKTYRPFFHETRKKYSRQMQARKS